MTVDIKWLLVFILFAAVCVAAMRAQAQDQALGHVEANVVQIVTISADANGQITTDTGNLYVDCGMVPGVGYICSF